MSLHRSMAADRCSELTRSELIALGKTIIRDRQERLGCSVQAPSSLVDGRLMVRSPSGRSVEVFVSTQRVGGYVFSGPSGAFSLRASSSPPSCC